MAGALSRACLKRSRTRAAPTPTIISTNSEPLMEKNGTPASPATARASNVFPVPGAPTRSTPLGAVPPSRVYFGGSLRKSTISTSSSSASSIPATSSNVTFISCVVSKRRAVLRPIPMRPPPMPPCFAARRKSHTYAPMISRPGAKLSRRLRHVLPCWIGSALISTPFEMRSVSSPGSTKVGRVVSKSRMGRGAAPVFESGRTG